MSIASAYPKLPPPSRVRQTRDPHAPLDMLAPPPPQADRRPRSSSLPHTRLLYRRRRLAISRRALRRHHRPLPPPAAQLSRRNYTLGPPSHHFVCWLTPSSNFPRDSGVHRKVVLLHQLLQPLAPHMASQPSRKSCNRPPPLQHVPHARGPHCPERLQQRAPERLQQRSPCCYVTHQRQCLILLARQRSRLPRLPCAIASHRKARVASLTSTPATPSHSNLTRHTLRLPLWIGSPPEEERCPLLQLQLQPLPTSGLQTISTFLQSLLPSLLDSYGLPGNSRRKSGLRMSMPDMTMRGDVRYTCASVRAYSMGVVWSVVC